MFIGTIIPLHLLRIQKIHGLTRTMEKQQHSFFRGLHLFGESCLRKTRSFTHNLTKNRRLYVLDVYIHQFALFLERNNNFSKLKKKPCNLDKNNQTNNVEFSWKL